MRKVYRDIVEDCLCFCQQKYIRENPIRAGIVAREEELSNERFKMKHLLIGFGNYKSGDLLLTRRSERRFAELGFLQVIYF